MEDVDGWKTSCSRVYMGSEAVIQPAFFIPGGEQRVCLACSQSCFPEGITVPETSGQLRVRNCSKTKELFFYGSLRNIILLVDSSTYNLLS